MNAEQFQKKYSQRTYIGDSVYVRFDDYHFILDCLAKMLIHLIENKLMEIPK